MVKRSVSLDKPTFRDGKERAARLGFKRSFSAYVDRLIREDLERELRERRSKEVPA